MLDRVCCFLFFVVVVVVVVLLLLLLLVLLLLLLLLLLYFYFLFFIMSTAFKVHRLPTSCKTTQRTKSSTSKRVRYSQVQLNLVRRLLRSATPFYQI